jgi:hypothetical protein
MSHDPHSVSIATQQTAPFKGPDWVVQPIFLGVCKFPSCANGFSRNPLRMPRLETTRTAPAGKDKALLPQRLVNDFHARVICTTQRCESLPDQGFHLTLRSVRQALTPRARFRRIWLSQLPSDESKAKANRRKMILFGIALGAVSLFMYISFIYKTAVRGP